MNDRMILLSYIIPIYNCELYIDRCLDSLNIPDNVEIIAIDDGSNDRSTDIVTRFKKKSNINLRVYKTQHQGLAYARNFGIQQAKGDYIAFLDSDDWLVTGTISGLCHLLSSYMPDVVITYIKGIPESGAYRKFCDMRLERELIAKGTYGFVPNYLMDQGITISPSVRYIIKRKILLKYNLKFCEDVANEDIIWTSTLLCYDLKYEYYDNDYYCYRIRNNSLSSVEDSKYYKDLLTTIKRHYDLLEIFDNSNIQRFILRRVAYYLDKICKDVQDNKIDEKYISYNLRLSRKQLERANAYCMLDIRILL